MSTPEDEITERLRELEADGATWEQVLALIPTTIVNLPLDRLRVDERYWPKGSGETVLRWYAEHYNPAVHPRLIVNHRDGAYYVLGWENRSWWANLEAGGRSVIRASQGYLRLGHPRPIESR